MGIQAKNTLPNCPEEIRIKPLSYGTRYDLEISEYECGGKKEDT